MAFTPEQLNVIRTIIGEGQRRYGNIMSGPGRTKVLSALATAAVEENYRNQPGGGGSSSGWRQETAESYPNVNRLDLHASVNRYYNEVDQNFGHYRGAPGALAQSVQRSAYPGRYSQHIGEAAGLIRRFAGKGGTPAGRPSTPGAPGFTAPGSAAVSRTVAPAQTADMSGVMALAQQLQKPEPYPATPPQPPSFSAGPRLAGGGIGTLPLTPPPSQRSNIESALMDVLSKQGMDTPLNVTSSASTNIKVPGQPGTGGYAPGGTGRAVTRARGTTNFGGKTVAGWIAPILQYARQHGWKGSVTSGFRSYADQVRIYNSGVRPAARPGTSNHEGANFPRGAVDVSDAATLARVISRSPYRGLLQWAGSKDPVHFSHPHGGSY